MTKRKYVNTSFMICDMRTSFSLCSRADFRNSSSGGLFGKKNKRRSPVTPRISLATCRDASSNKNCRV